MVNLDLVRKVVSGYHNPANTRKIAKAFESQVPLQYPQFAWESVSKALKSKEPYSLVLSGKVGLAWGEMSIRFPNVLFTNQITNPNAYAVRNDCQDDLSIMAFGSDSVSYISLGTILELYASQDRAEPAIGINLLYGRNKQLRVDEGQEDYKRKLLLHGDITSGFVLHHRDGTICPIKEI